MASRRISEFPAISGGDIDEQDLLTLVHVFEVDPTLRNKKITFTQFKEYLSLYYPSTTGAVFTGNVSIGANLTVAGASSFNTITASGSSTFSGIVVQNDAVVSGTVSGLTITGTNVRGTNVNAVNATVVTATGTTSAFTSGVYQNLSGATITGGLVRSPSGVFTNLSGGTITGTTVAATTGTFQELGTPVLNVGGNLTVASGLTVTGVAQFSSGVQVTGTLSGTTITGTTAQFSTVSGVSGVFTAQLSGATVTGDTARFSNTTGVSGTFTSRVSGATVTGNTGAFGNVSGISGVFTQLLSGAVITGDTGKYTTLTGVSGTFTTVSGATVTGNTVAATIVSGVSGVFNSFLSATTITGASGIFTNLTSTSGTFTTQVSGATVTGNIGRFTSLTGATGTFTTRVSGLLVTGDTGRFTNLTGIAGVFTTSISGTTITGNTIQGTSGVFTHLSGTTFTGTTVNASTGVFQTLAALNLAFTNTVISGNFSVLGSSTFTSGVQVTGTLSGTTITGTTVNATSGTFVSLSATSGGFTTATGVTASFTSGSFTSLTGTTVSGTTANFVSGTFTTQVSGATVTGDVGAFTSITGGLATFTSGVFAAGSAASPSISFVSDIDTGLYSPGANQVAISTNGTGRLFVDASGRIGAGTSAPVHQLSINNATQTQFGLLVNNTEQYRFQALSGNNYIDSINANLNIRTGASGVSNAVVINSSGSVGINTGSPNQALHVNGIIQAESSGNYLQIQQAINDSYINNTGSGVIIFRQGTGYTERLRIDSSGRLGLGTSSPSAKLTVQGGTTESNVIRVTDNSTYTFELGRSKDNAGSFGYVGGTGGTGLTLGANNTEVVRITTAGNVGVGTTAPESLLHCSSATYGVLAKFRALPGDGVNPFLNIESSADGITLNQDGSAYKSLMFKTGGSERARIDSSGRLLVGTSSSRGGWSNIIAGIDQRVQIEGTSYTDGLSIVRNENVAGGPSLWFGKTRSSSVGGNTLVSAGDYFGTITFQGSDGSRLVEGASITAFVDGTPGANDMPGRLVFSTTADGASSPTERMRIDAQGRVGIGSSTPSEKLSIYDSTSNAFISIQNGSTGTAGSDGSFIGVAGTSLQIGNREPASVDFYTANTERARIDSSGRLLVGTSSARSNLSGGVGNAFLNIEKAGAGGGLGSYHAIVYGGDHVGGPYLYLGKHRSNSAGGSGLVQNNDQCGALSFQGGDGTNLVESARIQAFVDGTPGANDMPGRLVFSTTADGASSPTERMRITNAGACIIGGTTGYGNITVPGGVTYPVGSTNSSLFTGGGQGNPGYSWQYSAFPGTGAHSSGVACAGGHFVGTTGISNVGGGGVGVYAKGGTGTVYGYPGAGIYAEGGTNYGASTTGNYGIFARTYQSNTVGIDRRGDDGVLVDLIQDGTTEGTISVSGTTVSYNGAHLSRWSQIPGVDPYDKDQRPEILRGTVMSNLDEMCEWCCPQSGEAQDNEQLNKTKISDVEGDKNVAGVFQSWDDDDDTWVNDYYLAMTGDFIIRIAAGVTVERGDLLMSVGDGTAKPQDDDIIRSKTIAKVISTNVSCTHPDGSYCVPCVLMAC